MSIITLQNISKSFADKEVLRDLDLRLDYGDRLALIGHNGSGKSTLLKIIAGLSPAEGERAKRQIASTAILRYLPQEFDDSLNLLKGLEHPELEALQTRLKHITTELSENPDNEKLLAEYSKVSDICAVKGAWDYPHRLAQAAAGLGLDFEHMNRRRASLSGGERMRLSLASILIDEPDILLLDEPTNHLDIEGSEWLETYLRSFKGCLVVVSHDRHFLDEVCNLTAELRQGQLQIYAGNYSRFKELQAAETKQKLRSQEKLSREVKHEKEVVQTLFSHRNIAAYHSRQKRLAKLKDALDEIKQANRVEETHFQIEALSASDPGTANSLLISGQDITVRFPDSKNALFNPLDFELRSGQKIMICGPNGCGKSNLLKALSAENPYLEGEVKLVADLKYARLDQWQRFADPQLNVLDTLCAYDEHLTVDQAREILAGYGFVGTALKRDLLSLSGGEKSRLALACLLLQKPDLLFLDEPTNHLDTKSVEILESALLRFKGTLVAVSHDRYFIEKLAETVWGFVGGGFKIFPHYSAYRNACHLEKIKQHEPSNKLQSKAPTYAQQNYFTAEERDLWPELKGLSPDLSNSQKQRQFRAKLAEIFRNLQEHAEALDLEITELEQSFDETSSAEIYEYYGQRQIRLEKILNLLVKVEEIREAQNR